jgi:DNA replication protein DnaC
MNELKKIDLLVLDDFGMNMLDPISGRDLLEVVEDRSGYRSMIISGQLPVCCPPKTGTQFKVITW